MASRKKRKEDFLTVDYWIKLLQDEMTKTDGEGLTVGEICDMTGKSVFTVRARLKSLIKSGKVRCVWTKRQGMDGRVYSVPSYILNK